MTVGVELALRVGVVVRSSTLAVLTLSTWCAYLSYRRMTRRRPLPTSDGRCGRQIVHRFKFTFCTHDVHAESEYGLPVSINRPTGLNQLFVVIDVFIRADANESAAFASCQMWRQTKLQLCGGYHGGGLQHPQK